MMVDARNEDFELAEIDNVVVIFTNARIDRDTVWCGIKKVDSLFSRIS